MLSDGIRKKNPRQFSKPTQEKVYNAGKQDIQVSQSTWASVYSVLILIASALIGFTAARNSLTWHLQRFWGASGDFWQLQWDKFLDTFGENHMLLWMIIPNFLTIGLYWGLGMLYALMDMTNRPAYFRKYKIQPGTNEPVDKDKFIKAIKMVLFNQFVVGLAISISTYYVRVYMRGFPPTRPLPTFHLGLFHMTILILVREIMFYYSHRLLHHKLFYKRIHKMHHEWTAPIAMMSIYCHPIEHVISNVLPLIVGIYITNCHVITAWLFFIIVIFGTMNNHSGYHVPLIASPEFHDFHHLKFNQNYGILGILDRIHNTDDLWRNSKSSLRHIRLLGLTSARELFPDN